MLWNEQRAADIAAEVAFDNFELTGAPIRASRLTVVSSPHMANRLNREYPGAQVKYAPIGTAQQPGASHAQPSDTEQRAMVVGSLVKDRSGTFSRAVTRARDAGASLELMTDATPERVVRDADAIIALEWPPVDEPTPAIAGLSAARSVMVCDTEYTAGWPTLDPQTWQPRGWTRERPIAVSIDPRDEEHSLFLALSRLASDPSLRRTLGTAAFDWWRTHATAERAAHAWRALLAEAASA
jgi:hypothetical protein